MREMKDLKKLARGKEGDEYEPEVRGRELSTEQNVGGSEARVMLSHIISAQN